MADTWLTIEQAAVTLGLSVRTVNRHINAGKLQSRLHEGRREVLVSVPDELSEADEADVVPEGSDAADRYEDAARTPERPAEREEPVHAGAADEQQGRRRERVNVSAAGAQHAGNGTNGANGANGGIDSETMLALADNWADRSDLAISAFQTLARNSEERAANLERSKRWAWIAVAVMVTATIGAVGWTTYQLTRTTVENQHLRTELDEAKTKLKTTEELAQTKTDTRDAELRDKTEQLMTTSNRLARLEGQMEGASQTAGTAQARLPATRPSAPNPVNGGASAMPTAATPSGPAAIPAPRPFAAAPANGVTRPPVSQPGLQAPQAPQPANGRLSAASGGPDGHE